jgi:hypothetical protein
MYGGKFKVLQLRLVVENYVLLTALPIVMIINSVGDE